MSQCIPYNIIGLSPITCPCPEFANKPNEAILSDYYVDTNVSIQDAVMGDCGSGSVWDKLAAARKLAVDEFISDFSAVLLARYNSIKKAFYNEVAHRAATSYDYSSLAFCGQRIDCFNTKGLRVNLKNVSIGVSIGGTSVVNIWKGYSSNGSNISNIELVSTQNVTLFSNVFTEIVLASPLSFTPSPFEHYFITYSLPLNSKPKNNLIAHCGCSGHDYTWHETINVRGFNSNSESKLDLQNSALSLNANGIILKPSIICDVSKFFCNVVELGMLDPRNFLPLALAISYKAAANLLTELNKTSQISFASLTNMSDYEKKMAVFLHQYSIRLTHLAAEFPVEDFDCISCSQHKTISYATRGIIT
jgi:hypothetical protein